MKKLRLGSLLVFVLLTSCDKKEDGNCECVKETYKVDDVSFGSTSSGLPTLNVPGYSLISTESVVCQDEQEFNTSDGKAVIKCN
ncbi:hypothetical protein [Maribacter sp. ACAM166]|uniref:hypothetical protein n=1 Tax=Maribacter sp. ACAM166 TaxID=2508996 RepID=UPI0010FD31B4|nr:hypothetical protein [Maribacter sp. ACAM166]TLP80922.1 hypothetical protein ES765_05605 [Maribacter sp. ACAM166]